MRVGQPGGVKASSATSSHGVASRTDNRQTARNSKIVRLVMQVINCLLAVPTLVLYHKPSRAARLVPHLKYTAVELGMVLSKGVAQVWRVQFTNTPQSLQRQLGLGSKGWLLSKRMLLTGFVVTTIMMHNTTQLSGLTWQDAGKPLNTQALPTKMFEENETSEDSVVSKIYSPKLLDMAASTPRMNACALGDSEMYKREQARKFKMKQLTS